MTGGGTIAGQYGSSSSGQKQQVFGRVDPFCLFAVVPILGVGVFAIWGGIAVLGIPLILVAALIVVVDSWANRPRRPSAPAPQSRGNRR